MRILITGATGFVGWHLVQFLLNLDVEVIVLARDPEAASRLFDGHVSIREGELENKESLAAAVRDAQIVFHLASQSSGLGASSKELYHINVEGTQYLLEACNGAGVRRFVYCSTASVMGHVSRGPVNETATCRPTGEYEKSKHAAETIVLGNGPNGCSVVVVRPPWIYGPGDIRSVGLFRMVKSGWFMLIGDGNNLHHPVYIDDLILGLYQCAVREINSGEILIIAGKEIVTSRQLITTLANLLHVTLSRIRIPLGLAQFLAVGIAPLFSIVRLKFPITKDRLEFFRVSRAYNTSRAKKLLGYEARTDLEAGLRHTIAWYSQHGYL